MTDRPEADSVRDGDRFPVGWTSVVLILGSG